MGARMYFVDKLMPYHLDALGVPFESIPSGARFMLLSFMHGVGIGAMSTAAAATILLFAPFRAGRRWAGWAVNCVLLMFFIPMTLLINDVSQNTAGNPPLWSMFFAFVMIGLATVLSNIGLGRKPVKA